MPLLGMYFRHLGSVFQGIALDLEDPGLLLKSRFKVEARTLLVHRRRQKNRRDLEGRGKRSGPGGGAALESRSVSEGDPGGGSVDGRERERRGRERGALRLCEEGRTQMVKILLASIIS